MSIFEKVRSVFIASANASIGEILRSCTDPNYYPLSPDDQAHLANKLKLVLAHNNDEAEERNWYIERGQKLVDRSDWSELSKEIHQFDSMRATTMGGTPVAELLTKAARNQLISPIETALLDKVELPNTRGFNHYHELAKQNNDDHIIGAILAFCHIDAGWIWHDFAPNKKNSAYLEASRKHFSVAREVLNNFDPKQENSPLVALAQCAALAGLDKPHLRVCDDYDDLIELDPTTPRHMRHYGLHLLPQWYGSYALLETCAHEISDKTAEFWGNGAYSWMYLDALAVDPQIFSSLDINRFLDGIIDIFERRTDQRTANLFAAYLSVGVIAPEHHALSMNTKHNIKQLNDTAKWVMDSHLREIHPRIWFNAVSELELCKKAFPNTKKDALGTDIALRTIASTKGK